VEVTSFDDQPDGATPLTAEDVEGLKQSWITTQGELNHAEAQNILQGRLWANLRADYLTALRQADTTADFTALLEFARRTG
jgi:fido (protein-threonine AMPylation protein)